MNEHPGWTFYKCKYHSVRQQLEISLFCFGENSICSIISLFCALHTSHVIFGVGSVNTSASWSTTMYLEGMHMRMRSSRMKKGGKS
jgi:hypothetical protein